MNNECVHLEQEFDEVKINEVDFEDRLLINTDGNLEDTETDSLKETTRSEEENILLLEMIGAANALMNIYP